MKVFTVIGILHGMMDWLAFGIVGSYHEVLHVIHAGPLEPIEKVSVS